MCSVHIQSYSLATDSPLLLSDKKNILSLCLCVCACRRVPQTQFGPECSAHLNRSSSVCLCVYTLASNYIFVIIVDLNHQSLVISSLHQHRAPSHHRLGQSELIVEEGRRLSCLSTQNVPVIVSFSLSLPRSALVSHPHRIRFFTRKSQSPTNLSCFSISSPTNK